MSLQPDQVRWVAHLARLDLGEAELETMTRQLSAILEYVDQLQKIKPRHARIVELHYIGGLSFDEIGAVLDISPRTAKRDWAVARVWLFKQIAPAGAPTA